MVDQLYEEGFSFAEKAKTEDANENFNAARMFYVEAANAFLEATKLLPSSKEKSKQVLFENIKHYLIRAEELIALTSLPSVPSQAPSANIVKASTTASDINSNSSNSVDINNDDVTTTTNTNAKDLLLQCDFCYEQALRSDEEQRLSEAKELYMKAADFHMTLLQLGELSSELEITLRERVNMIISRLESLKINNNNNDEKHISDHVSSSSSSRKSNKSIQVSSTSKKLTSKEIEVLKTTSIISGKMFLPWLSSDLGEEFVCSHPFVDPDGLLPLSHLQKQSFAAWKRPSQICDKPKMIYLVSAFPITQTCITDCSFVSALCVTANYERRFRKQLITRCIYPQNRTGSPVINPSGKYMIRLHLNGVDRKVLIDDRLPVGVNNQLLCSYSTNVGELWVSLLEKAFLKVYGGYSFVGSNSGTDLHILTGWIPERVSLKNIRENGISHPDARRIWERMCSGANFGDCLVTAGTTSMNEMEAERTGLVSLHGYAVLRVEEVEGYQLLQLKNPWAHKRWKGKFSPDDKINWTPSLHAALRANSISSQLFDNGVFWIDFQSLCQHFDTVFLNWNPDLFSTRCSLHALWPSHIGPKNDRINISKNPQYLLQVHHQQQQQQSINNNTDQQLSVIWLLLSRHMTSQEETIEDYLTIHVYNANSINPHQIISYPDNPYLRGVYINNPHYLVRLDVKPNNNYTLVISQYEKVKDITFTLKAYSTCPFTLSSLIDPCIHEKKVIGKWEGVTAGGSSNDMLSYFNNSQYLLSLPQNALVKIRLLAPKEIAINLRLFAGNQRILHTNVPEQIATSDSYRHGFCVIEFQGSMPAGSFVILPSAWDSTNICSFVLEIASNKKNFTLSTKPI